MLIRLQNLQLSQAISLNFLSQFPHPQNSRQIHPPTSLLSFCEDKLINIYKLFENKSLCINAKNCLPPTHSQNFCSNCINTPIASLLFSRIYTHLGIKNSFGADISVTKLLTMGNDLIKTHVVLMNCNKYKKFFLSCQKYFSWQSILYKTAFNTTKAKTYKYSGVLSYTDTQRLLCLF